MRIRSLSSKIYTLLFLSCSQGKQDEDSLVPPGYKQVWRDDFTSRKVDSSIWNLGLSYDQDPTFHLHWNTNTGGTHLLSDKYDGYIHGNNAYISPESTLLLSNNKETIRGVYPNEGEYKYTSSCIHTLKKRHVTPSNLYLEIKAKFPFGSKIWSSIYLNFASKYPPDVTVWEYFGTVFNPSWGVDEMQMRNIFGLANFPRFHTSILHNFQDTYESYHTWHTFGFEWTDEDMVWTIDGDIVAHKQKGIDIEVMDWPTSSINNEGNNKGDDDEGMYLVINHGLMSCVQEDDSMEFPNYLEIDYVAVYEKE